MKNQTQMRIYCFRHSIENHSIWASSFQFIVVKPKQLLLWPIARDKDSSLNKIRNWSNYIQSATSAVKYARATSSDWFWFCFSLAEKVAQFVNLSQSEVKQNYSKREVLSTFNWKPLYLQVIIIWFFKIVSSNSVVCVCSQDCFAPIQAVKTCHSNTLPRFQHASIEILKEEHMQVTHVERTWIVVIDLDGVAVILNYFVSKSWAVGVWPVVALPFP